MAVNHRRHVVLQVSYGLAPLYLLLIRGRAPSDVMDSSDGHAAGPALRSADQIDNRSRHASARGISEACSMLLNKSEAKSIGQQRRRPFVSVFRQRHMMETANGKVCRHRSATPNAIRVRGAEPLRRPLVFAAVFQLPWRPQPASFGDRERWLR